MFFAMNTLLLSCFDKVNTNIAGNFITKENKLFIFINIVNRTFGTLF